MLKIDIALNINSKIISYKCFQSSLKYNLPNIENASQTYNKIIEIHV